MLSPISDQFDFIQGDKLSSGKYEPRETPRDVLSRLGNLASGKYKHIERGYLHHSEVILSLGLLDTY